MKTTIIGLFIIIFSVQWPFAQTSAAEKEIIDLSKEKWQWMSDKNTDALDSLFHEEAVFVHMGGSWGKEQEINIIKSGGIWYKKADIHEVSVNIIDNTAILLNRITLLAEVGGNEVTNPFEVTEVYIKQNGSWKLGSLSFTRLMTRENVSEDEGPAVRIKSGFVRGVTEGDVSVFKGIPYAAPPVGEYRWRPPQPVTPWDGVREASEFGPNCAQAGWGATPGSIVEGSSEDCLYLNLWTPAETKPGAKLPVMVWIHGGAFVGGSGADPANSGIEFARQGVILMAFNYRLGRLGHFAFPALSQEHPEEPKGSYAYMDQIAALKWVQENIAAFGGDPDNVTIFGFSAGGVSVHSLLAIPAAQGLFHKAISESGGGRDGVLTGRPIREENADPYYPVSAEAIGINFARKNGIEGTDAIALAQLRALSVEEIVDGGQETDGQGGPRTYSGPILDGKLVVETAESAYKAGRQARVPLIIGNTSAEIGGGFVNSSNSKEELFSLFGELEREAKAAYDPDGNKAFAEVITKFNTDWVWAEPARSTASAFVAKGEPAYLYLFSYVPAPMRERMPFGAGHGSEVAYLFNNLDARWGAPEATPEDQAVAQMMNTYWANFAKTGDPNGKGLPQWPAFQTQTNEIMEFQRDGSAVGKPDPRKARLDVIEKAFKLRVEIQSRGGI